MRRGLLFLSFCTVLLQAADPKPKPSDYPVHFEAEGVQYGADYLVRTVSHGRHSIVVDSYLVVEIAVYPPPNSEPMMVSAQRFTLRINGKKDVLFAQTPGIVAASVKYPDWERVPEIQAGASSGDAGVIIGRPPAVERFPGDNRPASRRAPNPVPPVPTRPEAAEEEAVDPAAMVVESGLPEGPYRGPVAGNVFFAWKGNTKKIKTLELITSTASGSVVTRLR